MCPQPRSHSVQLHVVFQVACFAADVQSAFLKSLISAGFRVPPNGGRIMIGIQQSFQSKFLPTAKRLHDLGYKVTSHSVTFLIPLSNFLCKVGVLGCCSCVPRLLLLTTL